MSDRRDDDDRSRNPAGDDAGLTPREREVVGLMSEGRTNREIAGTLGLGAETVKTHLSRAYAKLGVRNRTEATRLIVSLTVPVSETPS